MIDVGAVKHGARRAIDTKMRSSRCKLRKICTCAGLARDLAQIVPEPIFGIPGLVEAFRH